jgi:hypothetical protein
MHFEPTISAARMRRAIREAKGKVEPPPPARPAAQAAALLNWAAANNRPHIHLWRPRKAGKGAAALQAVFDTIAALQRRDERLRAIEVVWVEEGEDLQVQE